MVDERHWADSPGRKDLATRCALNTPLHVYLVLWPLRDLLSFSSPQIIIWGKMSMSHFSFPGPMEAPMNLRVSDIESSQVTVQWDPVTRSSIMGELREYKVSLS